MSVKSKVVELNPKVPREVNDIFHIETIDSYSAEGSVELDKLVDCYEYMDSACKEALRNKYKQNLDYRKSRAAELEYTLSQAFAIDEDVGKKTYQKQLEDGVIEPKEYLTKRDGVVAVELILEGSSKEEVFDFIHKEFYHQFSWDEFRKEMIHHHYFHADKVIQHFNNKEGGDLKILIKWKNFKEGVNDVTTYDGAYMKNAKTYNQMVDRSSTLIGAYYSLVDYDTRLKSVEEDLVEYKVKLETLQREVGVEESEEDLKKVAIEWKKLGRTQKYIADRLGKSVSTIKRWTREYKDNS